MCVCVRVWDEKTWTILEHIVNEKRAFTFTMFLFNKKILSYDSCRIKGSFVRF